MEDKSYQCEACGITCKISAVDRQDNLAFCPWCGEPMASGEEDGPEAAEEQSPLPEG